MPFVDFITIDVLFINIEHFEPIYCYFFSELELYDKKTLKFISIVYYHFDWNVVFASSNIHKWRNWASHFVLLPSTPSMFEWFWVWPAFYFSTLIWMWCNVNVFELVDLNYSQAWAMHVANSNDYVEWMILIYHLTINRWKPISFN